MAKKPEKKQDSLNGIILAMRVMVIAISIIVFVISRYAFIFFVFGMMPTLVSIVIDKRKSKCASGTIGAFNLIGILPYLAQLWRSEDIGNSAQHMIGDISIWFVVYSSAGLGWIIIWIVPQLTAKIFLMNSYNKAKRLREMQKKILEEWDQGIDEPENNSES